MQQRKRDLYPLMVAGGMSACALLVVAAGATLVLRTDPQRDASAAETRPGGLELAEEIAAPVSSRVERTLEAVVGTPAAAMEGLAETPGPADSAAAAEAPEPERATRRGPRLLGKPVSLPGARETRRQN